MAKILLINGHQKSWNSKGRLNMSLMHVASDFFQKRGDEIQIHHR